MSNEADTLRVGDELLYQARIHPEQYSNTFTDAQIQTIHDSMMSVCDIACETLSDQSKFPADWIMKYRWDKGKKNANVLPNGEKITHIKVGGRTSAVVLSRQKKTGAVAGLAEGEEEDVGEPDDHEKEDSAIDGERDNARLPKRKSTGGANDAKSSAKKKKKTSDADVNTASTVKTGRKSAIKDEQSEEQRGRRRSARLK